MNTLLCQQLLPLNLVKHSPRNIIVPAIHPTSTKCLRNSPTKWELNADAKGLAPVEESHVKKSSSSKGDGNNSDEEEIPEEIFYRMIRRILVAVGVPMGLGLALLYVFGVVREQNLWEVPMWLPFSTTFITFGASLFGIVYGALSTSLDPNNKGSVLGLEEAQKHWDEMWEEEKTRE